MEVTLKPGTWVDPARMQQTIKDAGYKPDENGVTLRITGKVVKQGDQLQIELDKMQSPQTLVVTAAKEAPDLPARLAGQAGQVVEVEGVWSPGSDGKQAALALTLIASPR